MLHPSSNRSMCVTAGGGQWFKPQCHLSVWPESNLKANSQTGILYDVFTFCTARSKLLLAMFFLAREGDRLWPGHVRDYARWGESCIEEQCRGLCLCSDQWRHAKLAQSLSRQHSVCQACADSARQCFPVFVWTIPLLYGGVMRLIVWCGKCRSAAFAWSMCWCYTWSGVV